LTDKPKQLQSLSTVADSIAFDIRRRDSTRQAVRWILLNLALATGYFLLGKLSLALALPPDYVSPIWPAAGMAFAAALTWGNKRVWPGIFLGSLIVNSTIGATFHIGAIVPACGIAIGTTLQAAIGAAWLRKLIPDLKINRPDRVLLFSMVCILSCLIAATIGNACLFLNGAIGLKQLPKSFFTWWVGDIFGLQIFTPVILLVLAPISIWKRYRLSVGVPLFFTISLCGAIYLFVKDADERQLTRDFVTTTDPFRYEMQSLDRIYAQTLLQLAMSYQARDTLPGPEFLIIADDLRKKLPAFRELSWAPVLDAAGQARYAQSARQAGSRSTTILRPPGFAASADGLAAPVMLITPLGGNERAVGLDLLGEGARSVTVREALNTGKLAVSAPLHLAQDPDGPGGILVAVPIIKSDGSRGVLTAIIDLRLIDKLLTTIPGVLWELRQISQSGESTVWQSKKFAAPRFDTESYLDRAGVYTQQRVQLGKSEWRVILFLPHAELVREVDNISLLALFLALFSCTIFANLAMIIGSYREQQDDLIRSLAYLDGLTDLANRRAFDDAYSQAWRRCQRNHLPLGLIMIDIDNFKSYNDHYGHQAGDACLRAVAATIKAPFARAYDLVARYGGEEFACLMPECDLQGVRAKAEELRAAVMALGLPHIGSATGDVVTISLGVASMIPQSLQHRDQLIALADAHLYIAKASGRNQVCSG